VALVSSDGKINWQNDQKVIFFTEEKVEMMLIRRKADMTYHPRGVASMRSMPLVLLKNIRQTCL